MEIDYYASSWEVWIFQFQICWLDVMFLRGSIEYNMQFEREVFVSVWNNDLTSWMHLMHELSRVVLDTSQVLQMNFRKFVRRKLNEICNSFCFRFPKPGKRWWLYSIKDILYSVRIKSMSDGWMHTFKCHLLLLDYTLYICVISIKK